MVGQDGSNTAAAASKRFDVELFIVRPTLTPKEIAVALGLNAQFAHCVGEPRTILNGTVLPGTHRETRWRHSRRYETRDQWFADKVAELVDHIEPHKAFFTNLRSTGGTASVIVQFLGDGYFGDKIPLGVLKRLVDLELDLSIECFAVPQSQ